MIATEIKIMMKSENVTIAMKIEIMKNESAMQYIR